MWPSASVTKLAKARLKVLTDGLVRLGTVLQSKGDIRRVSFKRHFQYFQFTAQIPATKSRLPNPSYSNSCDYLCLKQLSNITVKLPSKTYHYRHAINPNLLLQSCYQSKILLQSSCPSKLFITVKLSIKTYYYTQAVISDLI